MELLLEDDLVQDIVVHLDAYQNAYVYKQEGKLQAFLPIEHAYLDEELIALQEKEFAKLKESGVKYIELHRMPSYMAYKFMKDFVAFCVSDEKIVDRLTNVLEKRKPFRQFKDALFNYGDLRKQWFAYEFKRQKEWLLEEISEL